MGRSLILQTTYLIDLEIYRYLQRNNMLIGSNDLWIAATAVAHAMPIVTRNRAHFSRVPGVEVIAYAE